MRIVFQPGASHPDVLTDPDTWYARLHQEGSYMFTPEGHHGQHWFRRGWLDPGSPGSIATWRNVHPDVVPKELRTMALLHI